jgi:LemA protein
MTLVKIFLSLSISLNISYAVAQVNNTSLQKRWTMVDVVGNKAKKDKYEKLFAKHTKEMELKAGGKFFIYEDGVLQEEAKYTMASDGKSFLVNDGKAQLSIKIISLNGETLQAVSSGFMASKDTIIYKVASSELAKTLAKSKNAAGWYNIEKAWMNLSDQYQRRADLTGNFIQQLKGIGNFDEQLSAKLTTAKQNAVALNLKPADLSAQTIKDFQAAQTALKTAINNSLDAINKKQEFSANNNIRQIQEQLEGLENQINISRQDYNMAVMQYNGSAKNSGTAQKNIAFVADAGPVKAPQVKF